MDRWPPHAVAAPTPTQCVVLAPEDSEAPTDPILTTKKVYLLAGQSNMDGFGYITGLPPSLRLAQEDVTLYFHGVPGPLSPASTGGMTYVGPEMSFGRRLADAELPTSLRDSFDYTAIEPLKLAPGDYVVAIQTWSWDTDRYADGALGASGSGVEYTGAAYHSGYYLNYPEVRFAGDSSNMAFLGPNFLYVPAP